MKQLNLITADPLQDGISSVKLTDHMGDDLMVVNAARVSMEKESWWDEAEFDEVLKQGDAKLIEYLAKHNHWTPFSHPQIQFRIKMPVFIARQWFKHTIGFTRNEVSRRYVSTEPELHVAREWRKKAPNVKQGSSADTVDTLTYRVNGYQTSARAQMTGSVRLYNAMIDAGVCPEQARMVLPQGMYTEFIETGSLAAYARLAKLRLDPHAQKEIREYAQAVADNISKLFPTSWQVLSQ